MTAPWVGAFVVLAFLVLLLCFVVVGVLRRVSSVLERTEAMIASGSLQVGLAPGSEVPVFSAAVAGGGRLTQSNLPDEPTLLVFLQEQCPPCKELILEMESLEARPLDVPVLLVTDDEDDAARLSSLAVGSAIVCDDTGAVASAFHSVMFPYAFAVDSQGIIVAKAIANTLEDLRRLEKSLLSSSKTRQRVH